MSTARRIPLSSNQNVANSPIRASGLAKPKRSHANLQREEAYAQPPPAKKQMVESGIPRPPKSPQVQQRVAKTQLSLQSRRTASTYESKLARERSGQHHNAERTRGGKYTERDLEEIQQWQSHHRLRFPNMVFYFDNIADDTRAKLVKQIMSLGAREERFFSSEVTHVVTSRPIPPEQKSRRQDDGAENHNEQQQPQTINPSLLDRSADQSVRRKLFPDAKPKPQVPSRTGLAQMQDTRPKRSTDILSRAREMNKKIWSQEKLARMLSMLLEPDLNVSAAIAYGTRSANVQASQTQTKAADDRSLLQLLHNERVNGPSDRDPTVTTKELHYFRGPYLYIYDFEEKQKPIMVREFNRVQDKSEGDWPQFRTAPQGRCPFVEDYDHREVVKPKKREVAKPAAGESKPILQPPEAAPTKPVTGKRSLAEMENAHNRGSSVPSTELFNPPKPVTCKKFDFRPNAFTSRAGPGRLFGGEPVASGVQPSNVTSAIRSQMISSTAATPGAIGVVSKEVHGLQRKVLQRNSSHDMSSRRTLASVETSLKDETESKRSTTLSRTSSKKLELIDEQTAAEEDGAEKTVKVARAVVEKRVAKPKKRDPKPGYCENCQDKFEDFDEHVYTKKHRRFADNDENWEDLDDLLSQLGREPRHKPYSTWTPTLPEYPVY